MVSSPALSTDRYELTMLSSLVADGTACHRAVFEAFARSLPTGRRYGVVAGIDRLVDLIEQFVFDADDLAWLLDVGAIDAATAQYLNDFRFTGDIDALREGDLYFAGTPVLTVTGTLGECVLLETLILSVLNHDIAVASAAARMVCAAAGRPLVEMGSRRTHEDGAVAAARAAYLAGFAATSNLAAGRMYDIPTVGTASHAFTLAHRTEADAFRSQLTTHGVETTLLVDTYDTADGIRTAVAVARELGAAGPGAIRLDSGDLAVEARRARALLDQLGATETRIVVTSDLDEYLIADLATTPVDGYGVGTHVVTGSGHPTAGMVYKLVAVADSSSPHAPMRPVAKTSQSKESAGGRKHVWREYDTTGTLLGEVHAVDDAPTPFANPAAAHLAQVPTMRHGRGTSRPSLARARSHAAASLATLPADALSLSPGDPAITPRVVAATKPISTSVLMEA